MRGRHGMAHSATALGHTNSFGLCRSCITACSAWGLLDRGHDNPCPIGLALFCGTDFKHLGSAGRAHALLGGLAVLHGDGFDVFGLSFFFALHAIGFHCFSPPVKAKYFEITSSAVWAFGVNE